MAEIRTPQGLVVGLIVNPKDAEKNEPKNETPSETMEKKRGGRPKTEK